MVVSCVVKPSVMATILLQQFSNDSVESNCAIAIATLCDWSKNLAPVFQPMRSKTKSQLQFHFVRVIFPALEHVIVQEGG